MLKILSIKAGVKKLDLNESFLFLWFSELHQKHPLGLLGMVEKNPKLFYFMPDNGLKAVITGKGLGGIIAQARNILMEIAGCVN